MWKIWSRELPYVDRSFQSILDLRAGVLGGVIPSVQHDDQINYVELMSDCWACDKNFRPTFHEIAIRLGEMRDSYCSFGERLLYALPFAYWH